MFSALNQNLLNLAVRKARDVECPKCKRHFAPFAGREITSWWDFAAGGTCPQCGAAVQLNPANRQAEPPLPETQPDRPAESQIERRPVSSRELLFYIPASGRWGGLLLFAALWNLVSVIAFVTFGFQYFKGPLRKFMPLTPVLFTMLFVLIGIGLFYAAFRTRYATHLLYLSPEMVRLQRTLFGRSKNHDLPTAEVRHVKKVEFYQQNYQPVHGVEIGAGKRRIRFGSALTDPEKSWLCWEVREFLRSVGARL